MTRSPGELAPVLCAMLHTVRARALAKYGSVRMQEALAAVGGNSSGTGSAVVRVNQQGSPGCRTLPGSARPV